MAARVTWPISDNILYGVLPIYPPALVPTYLKLRRKKLMMKAGDERDTRQFAFMSEAPRILIFVADLPIKMTVLHDSYWDDLYSSCLKCLHSLHYRVQSVVSTVWGHDPGSWAGPCHAEFVSGLGCPPPVRAVHVTRPSSHALPPPLQQEVTHARWAYGRQCGMSPGPWFSIKTSSYEYSKLHCGDKTVVKSSNLRNGISHTAWWDDIFILKTGIGITFCNFVSLLPILVQ